MIKLNEVKAATIAVSNESEENRVYGITAEAKFSDGKVTRIEHGKLVRQNEEKTELATFSAWNDENVNINLNGVPAAEQPVVFGAVNGFIAELRETKQPKVSITE